MQGGKVSLVKGGEQIVCPHCDLVVGLPALINNRKAQCPRCHTTLTQRWPAPAKMALGYTCSALMMFCLAHLFPFIYMEVGGSHSQINLIEIPQVMVSEGYISLALVFVFFVQCLPLLCMAAVLLLCWRVNLPLILQRWLAKAVFACKIWCMVEIFLVGVFVSFVKLMSYGEVGVRIGFLPFCLFCLLLIRSLQFIDRRWLWNRISAEPLPPITLQAGQSGLAQGVRSCRCCTAILPESQLVCPRCHTHGYARRKESLQWTIALLLTSVMLYIPANMLPIMVTEALGSEINSTILSGVLFLWQEGSYPVALVIFIASILVPSLKIVALFVLCYTVKQQKRPNQHQLLRVYEVVEFVGRWSMIDVFVIAVLSALVRMGKLMGVYPGLGAVLFASVVVLTMLAAMAFDPRLIWDKVNLSREQPKNSQAGGEY